MNGLLSPRLIVNTALLLMAIGIIAWFFIDGGLTPRHVGTGQPPDDAEKEQRAERGFVLAICIFVIVLIVAILFGVGFAHGRDNGRFAGADPEIKAWFDKLASRRGPCCSDADGTAVSDPDWDSQDGHYRVRIDGAWLDVPDDAVITVPNRVGRTMVWPIKITGLPISIRCFMPGAMG